jgi:fatty acid elongase 3
LEVSHPNFDARIHLMRSSPLAYSYFASTYWPQLPSLGSCHGTESAAVFGCALLSSYLLLFIKFYIDTYKKPARGKKPVTNGHANGNGFVHF